MNSRLDTIQEAVLLVKLETFKSYELEKVNKDADCYKQLLNMVVKTPKILDGYLCSWAKYTLRLKDVKQRDELQKCIKSFNIPSMVYYPIPMHKQKAFNNRTSLVVDSDNAECLYNTVLSLPIHPYINEREIEEVCQEIKEFMKN